MAFLTIDHPWVENSLAPIYVTNPPSVIEDEVLRIYLDRQLEFIERATHVYASVIMCDHIMSFSARQRAMVAAADKEARPLEAKWNQGQAYVLTSVMGRGILRAMQWMSPPVYPHIIVPTLDEGVDWCRRQLVGKL